MLKDAQYPVGGAAVETKAWIRGLNQINQPVALLTFQGAQKYLNSTQSTNIQIIESFESEKGIKLIRWIYYRIPRLYKAIKVANPHCIVKEVAGLSTGIVAFISKLLKIHFTYRVANDSEVDHRISNSMPRYSQYAFEYAIRVASGFICQNQYQYDQLHLKFPHKPKVILPNPYEEIASNTYLRKRSERKYIAWVGVFQKQKNLELLHRIVSALPNVRFKIGGMPKISTDQETTSIVKLLEGCSNVEFVGYVQRRFMVDFLSKSILLLNTSHHEGFSNTFLESFASGTPVCTTANVDPNSIIQKHKLGKVGKTQDKLIDAVKWVLELPSNDYDLISQKCRNYVRENHNPKVLAEELMEFINTVTRA